MIRSDRTWLELLLDGEVPDWAELEKILGPDSPELARAHRTARLCQALADSRRQMPEPTSRQPPDELTSFRWGHLQVREQIGHGSSGTVYRAFDTVLERDVALKLLDDDPMRARAFIAEARRLAQVRHGNVLAVYGAAVHDGRAGLWSDMIEGLSLDQWIEANGPRNAMEVLGVARALASALETVHAAGLVHGDVKPGNVVREAGSDRIVLMDFGSAGDYEFAARHGLLGSPASMAPEQVRGGSVGPSADIYGLGVVLFHAASGRYPAVADRDDDSESATVIRHLALPRALRRLMQEMLAHAPEDRPTASTVVRCLERITGAPQRRRRQAGWVTVIAALAVGMGISLWQADKAREQAEYAKHSRDFVVSLLRDAHPGMSVQGAELRAIDLLKQSAARVESELGNFPALQAELRFIIAMGLLDLGEPGDALPLAEQGLAQLRATYGSNSLELVGGLYTMARIQAHRGAAEESEALAREAIALIDHRGGTVDLDSIRLIDMLARSMNTRGRHEEAIAYYERALTERINMFGPDHPALASVFNNLASSYIMSERYTAAEEAYNQSGRLLIQEFGPDHPNMSYIHVGLGAARMGQERWDEAEQDFFIARDIVRRKLGPRSARLISIKTNIGHLRRNQSRLPEAQDWLDRAVTLSNELNSDLDAAVAGVWLGLVLLAQDEFGKARSELDRTMDLLETLGHQGTPRYHLVRTAQGVTRAMLGDAPGGSTMAEAAISAMEANGQAGHQLYREATALYASLSLLSAESGPVAEQHRLTIQPPEPE